AYAKGLRTVKTCVGTDWCRFGTQDSTGLGIRIEKFMWSAGRSWTMRKSAAAISIASSSPRKFAQVDPWSERVSGKDKHEFQPLATVGYPQAAE
ncbi:NAD(P)H-nitrite reductase large subunit, partial [Pseudorhizobium tarimense]